MERGRLWYLPERRRFTENIYFNKLIFSDTTETSRVMDDIYLKNIPFPIISKKEQKPFIELVDIILTKKEKGEDTSNEENIIDNMIYKLYDLSEEEVSVIEGKWN